MVADSPCNKDKVERQAKIIYFRFYSAYTQYRYKH